MKFVVTLVKMQQCQVETESDSLCEALRHTQMMAQLGQIKNLQWKDTELYGKDVEEITQ